MIQATRKIALRSFGSYRNGLIPLEFRQDVRAYSIKTGLKQLNKRINRFGEENTRESEVTLKILRKIGGVSVIVVLCLILWASTLIDNPVSEPLPLPELRKDVRDT
mmetsp:Transcript_7561/g.7499  ORF Transcript_7561/g.7499 Transcript_7561/m.7499 type:complete len:106 (+) Transcript_7561:57-374(+)